MLLFYCILICLLRRRNEAYGCHYTAHQRTDEVEETEWQIYYGRHTEHRALRHAAGCPWNQYGGYRGGVFCAAAQQFGAIATPLVFLAEDGGVHDDRKELVAHHHIEQQT